MFPEAVIVDVNVYQISRLIQIRSPFARASIGFGPDPGNGLRMQKSNRGDRVVGLFHPGPVQTPGNSDLKNLTL